MTDRRRQDDRGGGGDEPDGEDLVALVYGELAADDERAVRARVAADPELAGRLSGLERVRELYRGMADDEPPPRVSAQLLAHAAQAAQRESRPAQDGAGFWHRLRAWMQPLIAHPGLAAAASLILVAGVAGVLLLRKGDELTRSTSTETAVAKDTTPPEAAAPSSTAAPSSAAPQPEPMADAIGRADDDLEAGAGGGIRGGAENKKVRPTARRKAASRAEEKAASGEESSGRDRSRAGTVLGLKEEQSAPKPDQPAVGASPAPPPTPGPAEAPPEAESAADEAAPPAASPASQAPAKPEPSPGELHKRAVTAAASRRCLEVQSLGQSIRRLDPTYHEKIFRQDKRLSVCLSPSKPAKAR